VVLLTNGRVPWDERAALSRLRNDAVAAAGGGTPGRSRHHAKREVVPLYDDPASRDAGLLGALDPFIGLVERLWEERAAVDDPAKPKTKAPGQRKKKGSRTAEATETAGATASSRMMVRTRWFFKKENMVGLKGRFAVENGDEGGGNDGGTAAHSHGGQRSKEESMATMPAHDHREDQGCETRAVRAGRPGCSHGAL
jgi:hypothetical protein